MSGQATARDHSGALTRFVATKQVRGTINDNNNDATEVSKGMVYPKCKQLELGSIKGDRRMTGLRFRIDIPQGAEIESARVTFKANEWSNQQPVTLLITTEASGDGKGFCLG